MEVERMSTGPRFLAKVISGHKFTEQEKKWASILKNWYRKYPKHARSDDKGRWWKDYNYIIDVYMQWARSRFEPKCLSVVIRSLCDDRRKEWKKDPLKQSENLCEMPFASRTLSAIERSDWEDALAIFQQRYPKYGNYCYLLYFGYSKAEVKRELGISDKSYYNYGDKAKILMAPLIN